MNPRILKKLSKKADTIIKELGICKDLTRVTSCRMDGDIESNVRVDKKHLSRWRGVPNPHGYFSQLDGTVGYGEVSGYYEPEWEDLDAWSTLKSYVIGKFDDWENADDGEWPKNKCPRKVRASPAGILRYARGMASE